LGLTEVGGGERIRDENKFLFQKLKEVYIVEELI